MSDDFELKKSALEAILAIASLVAIGMLITLFLLVNHIKFQRVSFYVQDQISIWETIKENLLYVANSSEQEPLPSHVIKQVQEKVSTLLKQDQALNQQIKTTIDGTRFYLLMSQMSKNEEDRLLSSTLDTPERKLATRFISAPTTVVNIGISSWDTTTSVRLQNGGFLVPFYKKIETSHEIDERGLSTILWISLGAYSGALIGIGLIWMYQMRPAFNHIAQGRKTLQQNSQKLFAQNQKLLEVQHHSKMAQRIAGFGYWVQAPNGKIVCSEGLRRILERSEEEAPATLAEMVKMCPPEMQSEIQEFYDTSQNAPSSQEMVRPIIVKDGVRKIIRERIEGEGKVAEYETPLFGIVLDITEYAETESRLAHAQKMEAVGELTGGIAHDLNNMLAIISGNAELIGIKNPDLEKKRVENILFTAEKGVKLIDQMLLFSGRLSLLPTTVDLKDVINNISELLSRSLTENVELKYDLDETLWPVFVDQSQMENVIVNLVINARDAVKENAQITIGAKNIVNDDLRPIPDLAPGEYVCLSVQDNGDGMAEATQKRIFEPFFSTKKETKSGTGLGLAMVYGFVSSSKGHIDVDSTLGEGSTFKVYLPRSFSSIETESDAISSKLLRGNNETILVVEDQVELIKVIVTQLQGLGYSTLEANNATEAKQMIKEGADFDLILSDIILPGGLNGVEFMQDLEKENPNVKCIFMSGNTMLNQSLSSQDFKQAQFLRKPFSVAALSQALRDAFD